MARPPAKIPTRNPNPRPPLRTPDPNIPPSLHVLPAPILQPVPAFLHHLRPSGYAAGQFYRRAVRDGDLVGEDGGRGVGGSETGAADRTGGDGGQLRGVRVQQDVLAGDGL